MFGTWYPAGSVLQTGQFELNTLGIVALGGTFVGITYFISRSAAKRAYKRGYDKGYSEGINDPETFIAAIKKAKELGIIREHVIVAAPVEEDEEEEIPAAAR